MLVQILREVDDLKLEEIEREEGNGRIIYEDKEDDKHEDDAVE